MFKVIKEKKVFDDRLIIEKAKIAYKNKKFSRLKVKREDAVAVLIFNTDTNKIILTKQFRYPIASKTKQHILEIVAGKIDKGEKPLRTAIREVEEETGNKIKPKNITFLLSCFSTPGYSSECFFFYYATVSNADKVSENHGLEKENEYIELVEISIVEFAKRIETGKIKDAKTYIAGLYLYSHLIFKNKSKSI
jgi:nudix-type nucleoside diphosphatase (YffH/AdpP family)